MLVGRRHKLRVEITKSKGGEAKYGEKSKKKGEIRVLIKPRKNLAAKKTPLKSVLSKTAPFHLLERHHNR